MPALSAVAVKVSVNAADGEEEREHLSHKDQAAGEGVKSMTISLSVKYFSLSLPSSGVCTHFKAQKGMRASLALTSAQLAPLRGGHLVPSDITAVPLIATAVIMTMTNA